MFVFVGDVPRVDGKLAVARAFGDKSLKMHLSSEPDVVVENVEEGSEFLILASDGIWKVSFLILTKAWNSTLNYKKMGVKRN